MPSHKSQHYVPRFLLEKWHTAPDSKLTSFRWAHGQLKASRLRAKSVAKQDHLYSLQVNGPNPDVKVERDFLGPRIDDPASVVHSAITEGRLRDLGAQQRATWSAFLVSLMLRSPSMIHTIRERGREALAGSLESSPEEYLAIRDKSEEETLQEWVRVNHPSLFDDLGIMTLPQLVASEKLNSPLLRATWVTRGVDHSDHDLLLADRPLIYVGTLEKTFLIALPVSPRQIFLAFNDPRILETIKERRDKPLVHEANRSAVHQASTYVYATAIQQWPFIEKHLRR